MIRLVVAIFLGLCGVANAQLAGGLQFPGPGLVVGATYQGAGDIVSAAKVYVGVWAYNTADRGNRLLNVCDPSNVTCADWNSDATTGQLVATTNPLNGTDCTAVNTCTIQTAYDRSGALGCTGNACDLTQATAASRPTLKWSCVNSKPCMVFGSTQFLLSANNFTSLTQPYTISVVPNRTGGFTTQQPIIAPTGTGNGQIAFRSVASTVQMFAGTTGQVIGSITDSNFHSFQAVFNGASSVLFCGGSAGANCSTGGTSNSISPGTNATTSGAPLSLGSSGAASAFQVTETAYWASAFNGTQETNMTANQAARTGPF